VSRPIILIHGAWHGGWCFDRVSSPLRDQGYDVLAPDLPFTGAADDVAFAREIVSQHPGAVVLGHSYGGYVITAACSGLDVSNLVYLCAFVGETEDDRTDANSSAALAAAIVPADGKLSVDVDKGKDVFYQDCPADAVELAKENVRPMVLAGIPALDVEPAWKTIASTYVVCTEDRAILEQDQRKLARRCSNIVEWPLSHSPFFARPELMVELLADLAN